MALIELTLDSPALKRTEVLEGAEPVETTETPTTDSGRSRLTYLVLATVIVATLVLAVRAYRN